MCKTETKTSDNKIDDVNLQGIKIDPVFIQQINLEEIEFTFDGLYPVISGLENKEFQDQINKLIDANVNDFISDRSEDGYIDGGTSFEILTLNDSILSIELNYFGMVRGTGTSAGIRGDVVMVNVDLKNEKLLTNEDLKINQMKVSEFNRTVNKYFRMVCNFTDMFWEDFISFPKNVDEMTKLQYGILDGNLVEVEFACPCSFATKGIYRIPLGKLSYPGFDLSFGNVNPPLSYDTAAIISEATNGKFLNTEGYNFLINQCDSAVSYNVNLFDINGDGYPEVFKTVYGKEKCYGVEKAETVWLMKDKAGKWGEIQKWTFPFYGGAPGSFHNGYLDFIGYLNPNDTITGLLRWNGTKYEPVNRTEVPFAYTENKNSLDRKQAVNIVKDWISNLGKRDFQTAYNVMSPQLRSTYESFSSTKKYGGITKTVIHSVESEWSEGDCDFTLIADYDSYDPSNRDGKYTERFTVNNCNGNWQITSIENINVQYYR